MRRTALSLILFWSWGFTDGFHACLPLDRFADIEEIFSMETARLDCRNACNNQQKTFYGLKREMSSIRCFCGDALGVAADDAVCSFRCGSDNVWCGGVAHMSVHPVCDPGTHGVSCAENCTGQCLYNICNYVTGSCSDRCADGWWGPGCTKLCGTNCSGACNETDGACYKCKAGFYGPDCAPCGHCADGVPCNSINGTCGTECDDGWFGLKCTQHCPEQCPSCEQHSAYCFSCRSGWFGVFCLMKCLEGCLNGTCHRFGHCYECSPGLFGEMCAKTCPTNCVDTCDQTNGTCHACTKGWTGPMCSDEIKTEHTWTAVIGVSVALAVIVLLVVAVVCIIRKSKIQESAQKFRRQHEDVERSNPI